MIRSLARSAPCLLLGCALLSACDEDKKREPLPDWRAGYPDASAGDASEEPQNAFAFVTPESVNWPVRLGKRDAPEEPCAVGRNDTNKEIECIADVNELDLWVLGLKYDILVPANMCDMLLHSQYIFGNFSSGAGPTRVAYTLNQDGTFSDEVNSQNGKPFCEFDHSRSNPKAPNCCTGGYTLEVKSATTGKTTRSMESWGGKLGDCYYGAGYEQKDAAFNSEGLPMPRYTYVNGGARRESIEYKGVSERYPSNIALANYFEPSDHGGDRPAGLAAPLARPYYEAWCLDDAEEITAHIRLQVREWNEEAEFHALGNPNTTGTESRWSSGPTDIDDLTDWATQTPGRERFPSLLIAK